MRAALILLALTGAGIIMLSAISDEGAVVSVGEAGSMVGDVVTTEGLIVDISDEYVLVWGDGSTLPAYGPLPERLELGMGVMIRGMVKRGPSGVYLSIWSLRRVETELDVFYKAFEGRVIEADAERGCLMTENRSVEMVDHAGVGLVKGEFLHVEGIYWHGILHVYSKMGVSSPGPLNMYPWRHVGEVSLYGEILYPPYEGRRTYLTLKTRSYTVSVVCDVRGLKAGDFVRVHGSLYFDASHMRFTVDGMVEVLRNATPVEAYLEEISEDPEDFRDRNVLLTGEIKWYDGWYLASGGIRIPVISDLALEEGAFRLLGRVIYLPDSFSYCLQILSTEGLD